MLIRSGFNHKTCFWVDLGRGKYFHEKFTDVEGGWREDPSSEWVAPSNGGQIERGLQKSSLLALLLFLAGTGVCPTAPAPAAAAASVTVVLCIRTHPVWLFSVS